MKPTRRKFIKGTVLTAAAISATVSEGFQLEKQDIKEASSQERCPYFDQPRHCREKIPDRPLCDGN